MDETNVLKTTFTTENGRATLTDFMPVLEHDYNKEPPERAIYRRISSEEGIVDLDVEFAPKPNYARTEPKLDPTNETGVAIEHNGERLALFGLPSPTVADGAARSVPSMRSDARRPICGYWGVSYR